MQTQNKLFDDLARVANGAVSTVMGMKDELDALVRQRIERFLADADMVPRDEFDAVRAMAAKAREENEALAARVDALEAALKAKPAKAKTASARKPRAKTTAKTADKASEDKTA